MVGPSAPLSENELTGSPFLEFARWFDDAAAESDMAHAMAIATASPSSAQPSLRMVLLKGWDERGFAFFTNYGSRKARELEANPNAALLFYWESLGRQVRIEGCIVPVTDAESDEYFATRPRGAQISARISRQSEPIESRQLLEAATQACSAEFEGREVPRPSWWGGYRLEPRFFEFWQNREDRLHDRIRYRMRDGAWSIDRLQP